MIRWSVALPLQARGLAADWWFRAAPTFAWSPVSHDSHERKLLPLSLTALGVVYGDIGTSPLYAMREC